MTEATVQKQVTIRVVSALYRTLEMIAQQQRRSVPQAARLLLKEGLRQRLGGNVSRDETSGVDVAALAAAGGA